MCYFILDFLKIFACKPYEIKVSMANLSGVIFFFFNWLKKTKLLSFWQTRGLLVAKAWENFITSTYLFFFLFFIVIIWSTCAKWMPFCKKKVYHPLFSMQMNSSSMHWRLIIDEYKILPGLSFEVDHFSWLNSASRPGWINTPQLHTCKE